VTRTDAVVIGSGPNGLVAAQRLAAAGWDVIVCESAPVAGGAIRSDALTLPGFVHDTCSAFYGTLHATPVFQELDLGARVPWAHFDVPVAAAVRPGEVAAIHAEERRTVDGLGADGEAWSTLCAWWDKVGVAMFSAVTSPIGAVRPPLRVVRRAGIRDLPRLARMMLAPIATVAEDTFRSERAQALLASGATHGDVGTDLPGTTPAALILAMTAQRQGMPVPVGGAGVLAAALASAVSDAGGEIRLGSPVTKIIVERGRARGVETPTGTIWARHAVVADTSVGAMVDLAGAKAFPERFLRDLRAYRYGTGFFKIDLAMDGPIPWTDEILRQAGVVHVTGTLREMAQCSLDARYGVLPAAPALIVGQQTLADPTRAPEGKHTAWIETHVPVAPEGGWAAARAVFLETVFDRIEAFAPGFRARIAGQAVHAPPDLEALNANLVQGDPGGGSTVLHQLAVFRPAPGWSRYRMPVKGLYLVSAATHPGGGVHGLCGRNGAQRILRDARRPGAVARTASGARRAPRR
jgi:phytoene dehydrogenase-like protein